MLRKDTGACTCAGWWGAGWGEQKKAAQKDVRDSVDTIKMDRGGVLFEAY